MIEIQHDWSEIELLFYEAYLDWARKDPEVKDKMRYQVNIGPYIADFLYLDRYVIEVDGHDYHSSKEQMQHDYSRDRYMKKKGYEVMRFTGTEVYREANNCVTQMMEVVYSPRNVWRDHLTTQS
jgi:very-short-patch-repair endonuclease